MNKRQHIIHNECKWRIAAIILSVMLLSILIYGFRLCPDCPYGREEMVYINGYLDGYIRACKEYTDKPYCEDFMDYSDLAQTYLSWSAHNKYLQHKKQEEMEDCMEEKILEDAKKNMTKKHLHERE